MAPTHSPQMFHPSDNGSISILATKIETTCNPKSIVYITAMQRDGHSSPARDGGPFWETVEDFQTDTPLHHCFLDMTPHKIKYCENDP